MDARHWEQTLCTCLPKTKSQSLAFAGSQGIWRARLVRQSLLNPHRTALGIMKATARTQGEPLFLSAVGSESAQAVMAKYHRWSGLTTDVCFLIVLEVEVPDQGSGWFNSWWELSLWPRSGEAVSIRLSSSSHKDIIPPRGPALMTSSNLKHLPEAPSPNTSWWGLGLQHKHLGDIQPTNKHSVHNKRCGGKTWASESVAVGFISQPYHFLAMWLRISWFYFLNLSFFCKMWGWWSICRVVIYIRNNICKGPRTQYVALLLRIAPVTWGHL